MRAPLQSVRERSATQRVPGTARDAAGAEAVAAQAAAFDYETAERAELLREHQVLEALMQAQLKNEDEIMKNWIAMI
jgi:hypothetical protein